MATDDRATAAPLCTHALTATDALPDWGTIASCPVCWRRWKLAEARIAGWSPLPAATARPLIARMAAEAAAGADTDPNLSRGFYAFLVAAPEDEADFAAACVVAFAPPDTEPARRPPADFGWRALFAAPPAPVAPITRVWQWRATGASGTAPRYEARTFARGDSPPPFAPLPPSATRWVRERAAYDGAEGGLTVRENAGPLALTLADTGEGATRLTLRLRGGAGVETVPVRVYGGEEALPRWVGILSEETGEVAIVLDREERRAFRIEFDTAW